MKPEWLVVHRVINHRTSRDGTTYYLVKWRDLSYDQATWESENEDIAGLKNAMEYYQVTHQFQLLCFIYTLYMMLYIIYTIEALLLSCLLQSLAYMSCHLLASI